VLKLTTLKLTARVTVTDLELQIPRCQVFADVCNLGATFQPTYSDLKFKITYTGRVWI